MDKEIDKSESNADNQSSLHALWTKKLKGKFEYINKNAAAFSIASASIIAIISSIVKFEIYTFYCGMYDYWGVSRSCINATNQNVIFNFFFNLVLVIFMVGINSISYLILISKINSRKKKFANLSALIIVVFLLMIFFILRFFNISVLELRLKDIPDLIIIGLYGLLLFNFPGIWCGIAESFNIGNKKKKDKVKKNNEKKQVKKNRNTMYIVILSTIVFLIFSTVVTYAYGVYIGGINRAYMTIGKQYVVMCEDNDNYVISECSISNDKVLTVYKNRQKVIDKTGVTTEKTRFKDVDFE